MKSMMAGSILSVAAIGIISAQSSVTVNVVNPLTVQRSHETVEVPLSVVRNLVPNLGNTPLRVSASGSTKSLPSQVIDENADGVADLLLFQSDFASRESKRFVIAGTKETARFSSFVDGRFVRPREDFAWENDRIAFRMYGPALAAEVNSGIDVWCKRVRYLVVDKWYKGEELVPKITYHTDHGEGADFFSVGRTLGAGGAGLFADGKIHQPGVFSTFRIIANGPIRLIFELTYDKWNVAGRKFVETKRITLDAGSNLNRIDEWFASNDPGAVTVAAGLVKRPGTTLTRSSDGRWMSLWGLTNQDSVNGSLGTAVLFPFQQRVESGEDSTQWLMMAPHDHQIAFSYAAGAVWTRSGDCATAEEWQGYLGAVAERMRQPLAVSVSTR